MPEIVTEEMVRELKRRLHEGQPSRRLSVAEVRDALLAVAPLIRRAALEEAADLARDHTPRKHEGTLAAHCTGKSIEDAIRALATQEPGR